MTNAESFIKGQDNKATTTIKIDRDVLKECKKKKVNISKVSESALVDLLKELSKK